MTYTLKDPINCYIDDPEDRLDIVYDDCEDCYLGFFKKELGGGSWECEKCPDG